MPATYNGIGTHYYGKSNLGTRAGICEHCRNATNLFSYDTQLWFVVLFIPVISLGRKRVLDECPSCSRHRVMSLKEWETLKGEQLAKALAVVKASPDDAEAAIRLHGALVAFGQPGEAEKLGVRMRERFAQDARTQVYLTSISESEVATGSAASALPPRRVRLWPTLAVAAVTAVGVITVLVAVFGSNYYSSQHRRLYLVNGLNQAVTVDVAGRGSVTVGRQGWRELQLPEGAYRATVRGAVTQTVDFVVTANYFDRWLNNPVWVLNAGGSALLVQESTLYSASPTEGAGSYQFHFGEPFLFVRDVDYAFMSFPHEIQVQDPSKPLRKTRIGLFHSGPAAAFYGLAADSRMDEALRLAEWSLRLHPENTALLLPYVNLAQATQREAQCRALLAEAVQRRPVEIEWHRMHQQLRSGREELPALLAEYDALLKADPENSALLYLRGRLCAHLHEAIPLFQRALEHNPSNAFAHFALGGCRQSQADWSLAQASLARAVELMPHQGAFAESLFVTRLAQNDWTALEAELRATLQAEPSDYDAAWRLCQVLLAQNQRQAAESVVTDFARELQTTMPDDTDEIILGLRTRLAYAAGDFEAVLKHAAEMSPQAARFYRIRVLAESGNAEAAAPLAEADQGTFQDPFDTLAFSLACARAGQAALAETWRTRALRQLAEWRGDSAVAADLLERDAPVPLGDALDLSIGARHKALLLVVLAERGPTEATAFRELARRLNVVREFPWHLVNQIAEAVPAAATKPAN